MLYYEILRNADEFSKLCRRGLCLLIGQCLNTSSHARLLVCRVDLPAFSYDPALGCIDFTSIKCVVGHFVTSLDKWKAETGVTVAKVQNIYGEQRS